MLFLAVDDEKLQLSRLVRVLKEVSPDAEIASFQNPRKALAWLENNKPDVSFLDIEMPEVRGTMIAKQIKTLYPEANIVFVTAFDEYAKDAFRLHASGYLNKPVSAEQIKLELADLRYPMESPRSKDVEINCFGNFDAKYKGEPVKFKRKKTLELLAYLVDRKGASASVNEICATLWEDSEDDEKNKSHLRHLISDLSNTFEELGADGLFIKNKNDYAIDTGMVTCDYYDYIEGKPHAIRAFFGEYMSQYSWAERTLAMLTDRQIIF